MATTVVKDLLAGGIVVPCRCRDVGALRGPEEVPQQRWGLYRCPGGGWGSTPSFAAA